MASYIRGKVQWELRLAALQTYQILHTSPTEQDYEELTQVAGHLRYTLH